MSYKFLVFFTLLLIHISLVFSQVSSPSGQLTHKCVVQEILQTTKYTYVYVNEKINENDSLQWLALPIFVPVLGDTYYFDNGLQMGEFYSKELNKTFSKVLFLGGLSKTSQFIADKSSTSDSLNSEELPEQETIFKKQHSVVVLEVLQTQNYTYLRVLEKKKELWMAITKLPRAAVGQTYTYNDAAPMTNFRSKELGRTFNEILFLAKIKLKVEGERK